MTYRKRALTALVAGALALPLLATPASAGHGGPVAGPEQNIVEFCTNPFPETFVDVAATDVFARAIQCIATAGRETASPTNPNGDPITVGGPEGIPANQYGPNRGVLRGQMASFIARMIDAAERRDREQVPGPGRIQALPGYDGSNEFTDVPNNFVHVQNINRLADANIVLGGPGGRAANIYAPNEFISRAQMASFINRAAAYMMFQDPNSSGRSTGYTTTSNFFVDSGEIAVHQANINGLASVGIVVGVQPESEHRYAPRANVTRAQMAGFISRNLAEQFDRDRVHSLLEVFTGNFDAQSREDRDEAGNSRAYEARALQPGQEYRVTLVRCDNVRREGNDLVKFDRAADGGFADASGTSATIAGGANDSANSARFTPGADGVIRFTVTSDAAECVRPVLYINGAPGQPLREGGGSPRLEVDADGDPIEFFGLAGAVNFLGDEEEPPPTSTGTTTGTGTGTSSAAGASNGLFDRLLGLFN